MDYDRWYPTATLLANGKILVTSGVDCTILAEVPEVYDPLTNVWQPLTSAQNDRYANNWYPRMFLLKDGSVLHVGPHRSQHTPPKMEKLNPVAGQDWADYGTSDIEGEGAVMYRAGNVATGAKAMILKTGNHREWIAVTSDAEVISEDGASALVDTMSYRRVEHNCTILPDGTVLVTGGSTGPPEELSNAVKATERWNPSDSTWTFLAPSPKDRMYHSTAALLPDGRVLSAGGQYYDPIDSVTVYNDHADYFYPPYLYKNNQLINDTTDRPVVGTAPSIVACGTKFVAEVDPNAASISSACFIRPTATTHSNNMDQRYIPLSAVALTGDSLQITAPSTAEETPPGYYMLFFVNSDGVPSIASFVRVWGVVQTSIVHGNVGTSPGLDFSIPISWNTSNGATAGNAVKFYPPTGSPITVNASDAHSDYGRQHSKTWTVPGSCEVGWWEYEVMSTTSGTTTVSIKRQFKVKVCLD